jgi:disulfide oxidoreductase YuzD
MKNELKDALALLRKIKFSKDYRKFAFLEINRITDTEHIQKMIASIRNMGVIRPVICVRVTFVDGKSQLYVIDGQHLFKSLMAEDLEIPYVIIDVEDKIDMVQKMAMLNNSSKSWTLLNYVNAFKMHLKDYYQLDDLRVMYNIEPLMLATICTNGDQSSISGSRLIKSGDFKITNPNAQEMAKAFNDFFLKIGRADRWVKHHFLQVFLRAWGTYDHKQSLENLDKHINIIKAMSDTGAAEAFISKNIFNLTK